jgi:hypothetical protein
MSDDYGRNEKGIYCWERDSDCSEKKVKETKSET